MNTEAYDVAIIGGGASGTALLYTLARYTNISRIVLFEKEASLGSINSNAKNNSQTLHVGDIETNYSLKKAREVRGAALMVAGYANALPSDRRDRIIHKTQKMILAVGAREVKELGDRYEGLKEIFPTLERLDANAIREKEPAVMEGRDPSVPVLALFNPEGYAVNYSLLSESLAKDAQHAPGKEVDLRLSTKIESIEKTDAGYTLHTARGITKARVVVVDADAYSLGFAKKLGYGKEFSLIPIAGSFYFAPQLLRGKVYTMQEPRMPFAAVHGDPDLTKEGQTRFGPTARFNPVLESRNFATMPAFFKASGLQRPATWISFIRILLEPIRFWYLLKNLFYEIPGIGTALFSKQVRKIIPNIKARDISRAEGYGGMRLQRVDTNTHELLLGEGKIIGENIIFNMTPSPGASVCLYNAMRDATQLQEFFKGEYAFDKEKMLLEVCAPRSDITGYSVSLTDSYAS